MALKNIKNYLSCVHRNSGVLKTDQIELTETGTAPSSDLSDGRIYADTDGSLRFYTGSAWKNVVFSDDARLGRTTLLTVTNATTTTTLTQADSGELVVCNSTGGSMYLFLPAASTPGIIYRIVNSSTNATTGDLYICANWTDGQIATGVDWIGGTAGTLKTLNTQYDGITLVSDGSTHWLRVNAIA